MTNGNLHQSINTSEYFKLEGKPVHIKEHLDIEIVENAFIPGTKDKDWFVRSTLPALKLLEKQRPGQVQSFLSIGSGPGLDVLGSAEIFGARQLTLTDLKESIVQSAVQNITSHLLDPEKVTVQGYVGDLFEPLRQNGRPRFDLIYENLPSIPLPEHEDIDTAHNSSDFIEKRSEKIPEALKRHLLDIHYLALTQVGEFLEPEGALLSLISGVIPVEAITSLEKYVGGGLQTEILFYNYNIHTSFINVVENYVALEQQGYGPFLFYREKDLQRAFEGVSDEASGAKAPEIEASLAPKKLSATEALALIHQGEIIGYTIAILKSTIRKP